jgi:phosphoglycerol transferase
LSAAPESFQPGSLSAILRDEWRWWVAGALLSVVGASVVLTGWPEGLRPNLQFPYGYADDSLFHLWMAQRVIEGWLFENVRSGFPFGSNFLDYPGSDAANHLIIKILGLASGSAHAALNLFFLISFAAIFVATYAVSRTIGLCRALSACCGVIFAFQSFHFLRVSHVFFASYFVAPIFFYFGFKIFCAPAGALWPTRPWGVILTLVGLALLASFGVYYALFGVVVLLVAGTSAWAKHRDIRRLMAALAMTFAVAIGIAANIAPNVIHMVRHGHNPEAVVRHAVETEIHGLKLIQLLLPRPGHRSERLAEISRSYAATRPLVSENATAALGAVGASGFLVLAVALFLKLSGREVDPRLSLLGLMTLVLFLVGTIGGLGSIFALIVSPVIRAWNRVSIFIAYASVTAFFLALQILVRRFVNESRQAIALLAAAVAVGTFGILDQTVAACRSCNERTLTKFMLDRDFVGRIEQLLPANASVYQLPYIPFPEFPPVKRLDGYEPAAGFVHSKTLRWSFGGMKGREADRFFKALALRPIEEQIDVIRRRGFGGIYLDRRGYDDGARELLERVTSLVGAPAARRRDDEVVFFVLGPSPN